MIAMLSLALEKYVGSIRSERDKEYLKDDICDGQRADESCQVNVWCKTVLLESEILALGVALIQRCLFTGSFGHWKTFIVSWF